MGRPPFERPAEQEFAPFYAGYVSRVPEHDVMRVLEAQAADVRRHAAPFIPQGEECRYADGKWTVREVLGHVNDAERVFGFRAFCFGRGETNALPGFDQDEYVARAGFNDCSLADLLDEFVRIRDVNLIALRRLDDGGWLRTGTASGKPISVRALAYVMAGHVRHHLQILDTRYAEYRRA